MNDYVTSLDTEPSPEVTVLSKSPLQGLSFQQRLALRDLLREGPRTTNQLSSWWDWEGTEPAHRPEDERGGSTPRLDLYAAFEPFRSLAKLRVHDVDFHPEFVQDVVEG